MEERSTAEHVRGGDRVYVLAPNQFEINHQSIRGRLPTVVENGQPRVARTFTGKVDATSGCVRIDCVEVPEFWLEIELGQVEGLEVASAPIPNGGPMAG